MSSRPECLNKKEDYRNRGVEVLLYGGKTKQTQPFRIIHKKIVSLFKREFTIYFEFFIQSRKK